MEKFDASKFQGIVGLRLSITQTAADMRIFQFGSVKSVTTRHGKQGYVAQYSLHIQCPWRLEKDDKIITSSADYWRYAGAGEPPSAWTPEDGNRADDAALSKIFTDVRQESRQLFNDSDKLIVRSVNLTKIGDITFLFADGHMLRVYSNTHDSEQWRLLTPSLEEPHLVFPPKLD